MTKTKKTIKSIHLSSAPEKVQIKLNKVLGQAIIEHTVMPAKQSKLLKERLKFLLPNSVILHPLREGFWRDGDTQVLGANDCDGHDCKGSYGAICPEDNRCPEHESTHCEQEVCNEQVCDRHWCETNACNEEETTCSSNYLNAPKTPGTTQVLASSFGSKTWAGIAEKFINADDPEDAGKGIKISLAVD